MKKVRMMSVLAILLMLSFTCLITEARAASTVASGTCGKNLSWILDSDGTLTISGKGDMYEVTSSDGSPWYSCRKSIRKVTIQSGVTSIGNDAFYDCDSMTSITIPNSVTSIGESAFFYCDSLTGITIPGSVTSIGDYAFTYCDSLTRVALSSGLTRIGNYAFTYCRSLPSITIPASVTSIGNNPFVACTNLTTISVESTNNHYASIDGVLYAKDKKEIVIYPCGRSGSYQIRNGVTSIGDNAFCGCVYLTGVTIPDSVISIGEDAFEYCEALTCVVIPGSVTSIGRYAFYGCNSLDTVVFKGDMPIMEMNTFSNLTIVAYYPGDNSTWAKIEEQDFGGTITWKKSKPLVLKTEPKTGYAKMGEKVNVSVKAEGDALTYQWYIKNADASKYSKSSVTNATYSATMSDKVKGRRVYCVITDAFGNSVQSKTVLLREAASIVTEPKTTYAKSEKTAKVSVEASGDELTYQWYIKNAGAEKYSKSSITSATYSVKMTDKVNGRRAYCVVTDKYGKTAQSKTVILRMAATITTQPKSVLVAEGETARVTVKAVGDGLTYQWYIKNAGKNSFSKSSITKATYLVEMSSKVDGRKVYCVVTDKYGKTAKSDTVTLNMEVPLEITAQPKSVTVDAGTTAKVTVKASGSGLKYQWYYMNAGETKFSKSSITKSTYSVEMSNKVSGRQIYCVITDAHGEQLRTNTIILNITGGPKITTQPKNQTADAGDVVNVTVVAEGKGLTYEWYYLDPGAGQYRLSAAESGSTFAFRMQDNYKGRKIFCVITDSSGRKTTSKTITIQ